MRDIAMTRRTIICMLLTLVFVLSTGISSMCQAQGGGSSHNEQGWGYFKKGFYEYAPHNKHQEANQYYEMAVVEFKKAIAANEGDVAAHRNLARVYHVQKKYALSASQYKRVTELNPEDVDAYVNLAVAYSHLHRYDEAIEQLELAKTKTTDPVAIGKLNGYIEKLEKAR
jgi:tetratricopeptide (TPR) repeat protein